MKCFNDGHGDIHLKIYPSSSQLCLFIMLMLDMPEGMNNSHHNISYNYLMWEKKINKSMWFNINRMIIRSTHLPGSFRARGILQRFSLINWWRVDRGEWSGICFQNRISEICSLPSIFGIFIVTEWSTHQCDYRYNVSYFQYHQKYRFEV